MKIRPAGVKDKAQDIKSAMRDAEERLNGPLHGDPAPGARGL